mmetsp:Transcript_3354/g.5221  ORF Transcript_3354/g.5221 Transcript_3354/m.5221 type:complete len:357 (+) Transcript_3354:41-1111(+)
MAEESDHLTLRELASARPRPVHIGAAVWPSHIYEEPDTFGAILPKEFNSITLEAHHKWKDLLADERNGGVYNYETADRTVEYAMHHQMEVKGHVLCWPEHMPEFTRKMAKSKLREALLDHINQTMRHYLGKVSSWDVVNEAFRTDGTGRETSSILSKHFGLDYVADAFHAAHQADPNCKLLYNDCTILSAGYPKSNAVYKMVSNLVKNAVPINGIGCQGHINAASEGEWGPPKSQGLKATLRQYGKLGLTVNVSEMDVRTSELPKSKISQRDSIQAMVYGNLLSTCLAEPNFTGLTTWGVTDKHSWINDFFGADRPLLFDENYEKKPAYYAVANSLGHTEQNGIKSVFKSLKNKFR